MQSSRLSRSRSSARDPLGQRRPPGPPTAAPSRPRLGTRPSGRSASAAAMSRKRHADALRRPHERHPPQRVAAEPALVAGGAPARISPAPRRSAAPRRRRRTRAASWPTVSSGGCTGHVAIPQPYLEVSTLRPHAHGAGRRARRRAHRGRRRRTRLHDQVAAWYAALCERRDERQPRRRRHRAGRPHRADRRRPERRPNSPPTSRSWPAPPPLRGRGRPAGPDPHRLRRRRPRRHRRALEHQSRGRRQAAHVDRVPGRVPAGSRPVSPTSAACRPNCGCRACPSRGSACRPARSRWPTSTPPSTRPRRRAAGACSAAPDLVLFDLAADPPTTLRPGARVRFDAGR